MSEEAKARLMVILIVAMLAVTVLVAGWQQGEEQVEIDVEEGYGEIDLNYIKPETGKTFHNASSGEWYKNATPKSKVNGENNTLKFTVIAKDVTAYSDEHDVSLKFKVKGDFDEKYNLEELLFQMRDLDGENVFRNIHGFDYSYVKENNVDLWPTEKNKGGSSGTHQVSVGFDINENKFSAQGHVTWTIFKSNWNNSYTLRLQSVVKGMSEDVTATVDVNIGEEVKG